MNKYYDEKCELCDKDCHYLANDNFPNGKPYEACRFYGYILHPEKGISKEDCKGYISEQKWQAQEAERLRREKSKKTK